MKIYKAVNSYNANTTDVEKALFLCRWGVPFWALTYVFERNDMFWYRAYISLGSNFIVGTTAKDPSRLPENPAADEKHTRFFGEKAYVATTVARECIPGVGLADSAGTKDLTKSYSLCKAEALNLKLDYQPKSVSTDGWKSTQRAWKVLFPAITVIPCFLHDFLSIKDRCKRNKERLHSISDRVWSIYHVATVAQFSQRIRRLREWAGTIPVDRFGRYINASGLHASGTIFLSIATTSSAPKPSFSSCMSKRMGPSDFYYEIRFKAWNLFVRVAFWIAHHPRPSYPVIPGGVDMAMDPEISLELLDQLILVRGISAV